jgi:hypothetical protein
MKNLIFAMLLMFVFGGAVAVNAQTSQEITARMNIDVKASRSKIKVRLMSVADARCPSDVDCVWAGNAKVTLKLTSSKGKTKTVVVNTTVDAKSVKFEGYELTLGEVSPYPASYIRIDPNGYTAKIVIRKMR